MEEAVQSVSSRFPSRMELRREEPVGVVPTKTAFRYLLLGPRVGSRQAGRSVSNSHASAAYTPKSHGRLLPLRRRRSSFHPRGTPPALLQVRYASRVPLGLIELRALPVDRAA